MERIRLVLLCSMSLMTCEAIAQREAFDVVSYVLPEGWSVQRNESGIQLSILDEKTKGYAVAVLVKATPSGSSAKQNFISQWETIVKSIVKTAGEARLLDTANDGGWDIVSGNAGYSDGGKTGTVTLLSATGYGQTASVVLMTNTQQYRQALSDFMHSLKLNSAITGRLWEGTSPERFVGAGAMNGYSTGGFFMVHYRFNADGTYRFVNVKASAYVETNLLQIETGHYSINGNRLTVTPEDGADEEWSVIGGPIKVAAMNDVQIRSIKEHWGRRLKTEKRKLEKCMYVFRIEYLEGNKTNALILDIESGHTEREGNGKIAYYFETAGDKAVKLPEGIK